MLQQLREAARRLKALGDRAPGAPARPDADGGGSVWDDSAGMYRQGAMPIYWEALEPVSRYQFRRMTGREDLDPMGYLIAELHRRGGERLRGLCLGAVHEPMLEILLARHLPFTAFTVLDIAEGLLDRQRERARTEGFDWIEYVPADLNEVRLEPEAYDFILGWGTIHHVEKLERLFAEVGRALAPGGLFAMREYIGPDRLQLTDMQLRLAAGALAALPERYRRDAQGRVKDREERVGLEQLLAVDPSEAVRSSAVLPAFRAGLRPLREAMTGGTLLQPVLNGIAGRLVEDVTGRALLRMLILLEETLLDEGTIPSDYCFCLGERP